MFIKKAKNKKVAVFGAGITGLAACHSFLISDADVYLFDEAGEESSKEKFKNKFGNELLSSLKFGDINSFDPELFDCLVTSPGIPPWKPVIFKSFSTGLPVYGDLEIFLDNISENQKVIAVTGSNGKSTCVSLINHILCSSGKDARLVGNIGRPFLEDDGKGDIYCIELSSYQLDYTPFLKEDIISSRRKDGLSCKPVRFDVAVLLDLQPDHLDRYAEIAKKTINEEDIGLYRSSLVDKNEPFAWYAKSKYRIFSNQSDKDFNLVNIDSPVANDLYQKNKHLLDLKSFSINSLNAANTDFCMLEKTILCREGKFEIYNENKFDFIMHSMATCAAFAVCTKFLSSDHITRYISSFEGLDHRMEYLGSKNSIYYFNDSKATNFSAAAAALRYLGSKQVSIIWLAGGKIPENINMDDLQNLKSSINNVSKTFVYGASAEFLSESLKNNVKCEICADLNDALIKAETLAYSLLKLGNGSKICILLSPACQSFDQWRSFEERGNAFKKAFHMSKDVATDA